MENSDEPSFTNIRKPQCGAKANQRLELSAKINRTQRKT